MDTVLISGGTSGIGLATAAVLLDRGWNVAISGRHQEKGEAALAFLARPGRTFYIQGDVVSDDDCRRMVEETVRQFGGLDGLVTSAGVYEENLLENVTPDDMQRLFSINVFGTMYLCRHALPYLRHKPGSIVTVSSDAWPWKRHRTRYGSTASVPAMSRRPCWNSSSGTIPTRRKIP